VFTIVFAVTAEVVVAVVRAVAGATAGAVDSADVLSGSVRIMIGILLLWQQNL
jgi:hypothetical protein